MGHPVDVLVVTVKGDAPQCSRVKLGREEARLEYLIFVADKGRVETRREERVITELARFNNFDSRSEILLAARAVRLTSTTFRSRSTRTIGTGA